MGIIFHKVKLVAVFVLALLSIYPDNVAAQQKKQVKVITYNIWNGFDFGKDLKRKNLVTNWINSEQPDILSLQELCNYTEEKLAADSKGWGHSYSVLLKTTGYSVGITSSHPIEVKEKIVAGLHHGALHCRINGIDFLIVHLHPGSISFRRKEAGLLLEKIKQIAVSTNYFMVVGDFNSHSPFDADLYDPNGYFLNRLRATNADKGSDGNIVNNQLDYSVMAGFLSFPLFDVTQSFTKGIKERGSFPTLALGPVTNEPNQKLMERMERIDYILASSELFRKCISSKVCNEEANWYLSDHYPVVAVFDL